MTSLDFPSNANVLVGTETADDAGVYRINDDLALIQTVDFFTPVVDNPYDFGRVAAANALSDVYAMGGTPQTAMNIVGFPAKKMAKEVLTAILAGGADTVRQAGAVVVGGHSVDDDALKYGLAITGFVHPKKILTNQGLHPDDALILTKPLGTGIINTAIKGNLASQQTIEKTTEQMATLNKRAAELMVSFPVSACTDITGFGLLGHLFEMIDNTKVSITLWSPKVPILPEAMEFAAMGLVPIGAHNNRKFCEHRLILPEDFDPILRDILFDPQTSGGLLIGCPQPAANELLKTLQGNGIAAAQIGKVTTDIPGKIVVQTGDR